MKGKMNLAGSAVFASLKWCLSNADPTNYSLWIWNMDPAQDGFDQTWSFPNAMPTPDPGNFNLWLFSMIGLQNHCWLLATWEKCWAFFFVLHRAQGFFKLHLSHLNVSSSKCRLFGFYHGV